MLDIFRGLASWLKIEKVRIDNNVFRLHYKVTMILLVIFSLIVTSKQYIGDPIDCLAQGSNSDVIDTYCWILSTFTIPNKHGQLGRDNVSPGVGNYVEGQDEVKRQKYYQWVCFMLFLQAILFYIPRYIWKVLEGGRMRVLSLDLKFGSMTSDNMQERCQELCQYFLRNLHNNNHYFVKFLLCEVLNLINVVGQIFFVDRFLDYEFTTYGTKVLSFTEQDYDKRIDPMSYVFPTVTKCNYYNYGPSGTIERTDALCVLPLNIVNEKIYVFIWFWFIILSVVTALNLAYRLMTLISPIVRYLLLRSAGRMADSSDIELVCKKFHIGDWFIVYQISHNIDPFVFKQLIQTMADCLKESDKKHLHSTIVTLDDANLKA